VPPTLNLDHPDAACDLDGTPHRGRSREIRAALKLSIGFGGHFAAAVLRRPDGPRREATEVRDE
jgi:3-oxoacyl-[acyl-carrier-protein] synthase II